MQLLYDEALVEEAIYLCLSSKSLRLSALQVRQFHQEREKLYRIVDPDQRNAAFIQFHLKWFRQWQFDTILTEPLAEFPLLGQKLKALAFRQARGKSEEGAELYANANGAHHGVIVLRSARLSSPHELTTFLRREFMHLHDMLDPQFGYSPDITLSPGAIGLDRLVRERYRLLWKVSIDGRLVRSGQACQTLRAFRQAEFERAYSFWPLDKQAQVFEAIWNDPSPTHQRLLDWAADPRALNQTHSAVPGAPCPLCGFPTFHWAACGSITPSLCRSIQNEFPSWTPRQGACQRCLEIYCSAPLR